MRDVRDATKNGKTFLARRWSSVCVCVCLHGFFRLRTLLVGPGVVVLSRSLAVLSVQVLWCCLPDLGHPVFQRGRRPEDRSTKAATLELPFSGKPLAMKLGSQVVSAGLLVTVRLLYWSLGLPYSQPSLPVFLPPHASCYRVVVGIVQLPCSVARVRAPQPSRPCVQFHFPVALQLSVPAINRHSSLLRHANIAATVHIWSQVSCRIPRDSLHLTTF